MYKQNPLMVNGNFLERTARWQISANRERLFPKKCLNYEMRVVTRVIQLSVYFSIFVNVELTNLIFNEKSSTSGIKSGRRRERDRLMRVGWRRIISIKLANLFRVSGGRAESSAYEILSYALCFQRRPWKTLLCMMKTRAFLTRKLNCRINK